MAFLYCANSVAIFCIITTLLPCCENPLGKVCDDVVLTSFTTRDDIQGWLYVHINPAGYVYRFVYLAVTNFNKE